MAKYLGIPLTVSNGNKTPLTAQPELVDNGNFEDGTTDWSTTDATIAVVDGQLEVTSTASVGKSEQSVTTVPGKAYVVSAKVTAGTVPGRLELFSTPNILSSGSVGETVNSGSKIVSRSFVATSTTTNVQLKCQSNTLGTAYFDNVTLKEIAATETPTYNSPELVTNGDFETDSDWVEPAVGWDILNGKANYDGTGAQFSKFYQVLDTVVGKKYKLTFTLSGISANSMNFGFGSSGGSFVEPQESFSADGTYTRIMIADRTNHSIVIQNNTATQTFSVDNVSVKEVPYVMGTRELLKDGSFPPNTTAWTFGGGATLEANGAKISNESSGGVDIANIQQVLPFSVSELTGRTFELTYDVVATNGEVLAIQQSNNILLDTTTVGVNKKVIFNWDFGFNDVRIKRHASGLITDVTIDNVFLKELEYNYLQVADGGFKKSVKEGDVIFNTSTNTEGVVKQVIDNNVLLMSNDNFSTAKEFFNVFAANEDTRGNQIVRIDNYILSEYEENLSNPKETSFWYAGGVNADKVTFTHLVPATNTYFVASLIEEYTERLNSKSATSSRLDIPLNAFRDHQHNEVLTTTSITLS